MNRRLPLTLAFLVLAAAPCRAHFLWLTAETVDNKPGASAFLSETPEPETADLLKHIAKSKITVGDKTLSWKKGDDSYLITLPEGTKVVDGYCDLGVMKRGEVTMRLVYTGRVQFGAASASNNELPDNLRMRLVERAGKSPVVQVTYLGKPVVGAIVKAFPEGKTPVELKSDAAGQIDTPGVAEGKTGLLAKWFDKTAGEVEGKPFAETRYYATLTVAGHGDKPSETTKVSTSANFAPFAVMPEAVNSFGGAVSDGWLYVYSGHIGDTHKYSEATTTNHFRRLNLKDRTTWEELPSVPPLQGVTLVAHGGMLYRIGGAAAKNKTGTPDDLRSVADFARFDPKSKTWTDLPKLPSPRSTHDAVVSGDKIYVVGGWSMNGGSASNSEFCDDALVFDLTKMDATWEKLPEPPFHRRALAVADLAGKIYVLGGLTDDSSVVKSVDIYDPATKTWSKGPELPGTKLQGFAPSAFEAAGRLYVSGHDGLLHRLSNDGKSWETAGKLAIPRLTHRLLPGIANDLLAVGGNFANSPIRIIESLPLNETPGPKVVTWTVPTTTDVRQGQAVALVRSKLLAIGGNRSSEPHAFESKNLVREGVEFSLGKMATKAIEELPDSRQSATLLTIPSRKNEAFLIGGIGADGGVSRTLGDVFKLDASGHWSKQAATIPDARGMFGAAVYKDAVWIFGGRIWDPRPGQEKKPMPLEVLRWEPQSEHSTFEPTGQKAPRVRRSFAGAVMGSKYYMVGGLNDEQKLVDTVDVFDFDKNNWSTIASPQPRLFAELATLNGKLYLAGGFVKSEANHFEPAKSVECFDPATGKWSTLLEQSPVDATGVALLPIQGRLLMYAPDKQGTRQANFALIAP